MLEVLLNFLVHIADVTVHRADPRVVFYTILIIMFLIGLGILAWRFLF
ncbi:MAG: hypothetical protein KF745_08310 [Phycisphaeraceae bacterium]|nr:hypothetical protein [Phycisphaeraceae bacterium]